MNDGTYLTSANWKHIKSGKSYHIQCLSTRETDHMTLVHYRECTAFAAPMWTRTASEFFDGRFVRLFPGFEDNK